MHRKYCHGQLQKSNQKSEKKHHSGVNYNDQGEGSLATQSDGQSGRKGYTLWEETQQPAPHPMRLNALWSLLLMPLCIASTQRNEWVGAPGGPYGPMEANFAPKRSTVPCLQPMTIFVIEHGRMGIE